MATEWTKCCRRGHADRSGLVQLLEAQIQLNLRGTLVVEPETQPAFGGGAAADGPTVLGTWFSGPLIVGCAGEPMASVQLAPFRHGLLTHSSMSMPQFSSPTGSAAAVVAIVPNIDTAR